MTRVVLIGYAPEVVDYSDPALPPGMDAEQIAAGIEICLQDMRSRGWEADFCAIRPDDAATLVVAEQVTSQSYDCAVIGAGVRVASKGLLVFEAVINALREASPRTAIAFNTRPENSADAAARWIKAN